MRACRRGTLYRYHVDALQLRQLLNAAQAVKNRLFRVLFLLCH